MIDLNPRNELQWVKEGRVYHARHGELSTPQAFETDIVLKTPDMFIKVPSGIVIVPLRVQVVTEVTGAAIFQCVISTSTTDPGTVSNHSPFTPVAQNTKFSTRGSKVTVYYLATSTGVSATLLNIVDLHRVYVPADIDAINENATFEQVVYDPLRGRGLPTVIGDNKTTNDFLVYVGNGTSSTGYILTSWAEWEYDEFYGI